MKKFNFIIIFLFTIFFLSANVIYVDNLFATPQTAILKANLAEKILFQLQNNAKLDINTEKLYRYFDILCQEDTNFFSYKIKEIENLMDIYRENIITHARELALENNYKEAVDFLESKSELFKDKTTINSLINHYSKFFIKEGLFYCETPTKILSINKLIAYPLLAFKDNPKSDEYDNLFLTNKEFISLLEELYINDYILVDIDDIVDTSGENSLKRDLYLPKNKKPIILLFNNINYNEDEAFIDKFIIDSKEQIATFSAKQTEKNQISYDADFIPILENFINENKNFSFNNARAIISFDKKDNILGYNISKTNPNCNNDTLLLKKLATKLKDLGYKFAYGNFNENYNNLINYEEEIEYIDNTILKIFPSLNIFISSKVTNSINDYYKSLYNLGFKIFIDSSNYNLTIKNNFVFLSYKSINGDFLRKKSDYLGLNYEKIYDHNNRTKIY